MITRLIGKWLNAGVMECGELSFPQSGTPQGGVISPLLANIYLHHVLDSWWAEEICPRLTGKGAVVRYADDFVFIFEHKRDAERMMAVLPKRFGKHGLELHPEKTRMIRFLPRAPRGQDDRGGESPRSFDFLGFTHYWGQSRKGRPVIKRKTASTRMRRTLKRANLWLRRHRHHNVKWQHEKLSQALKGHYAYFGITGNYRSMRNIWYEVQRLWRKWLDSRSWKASMKWDKFNRLLKHYPLPPPRVVHSVMIGAKP